MMSHVEAMELALIEAKKSVALGEVPIGAVVLDGAGNVIGMGHNMTESWNDPTSHAEIMAIRDAVRKVGDWRLTGCRLYVTLEPCLMCAGAIQQSRIAHVIYGAPSPKAGALESLLRTYDIPGFNHYPQVTAGIEAGRCAMILADFFRDKRGSHVVRELRRDVRVVEGARLESE